VCAHRLHRRACGDRQLPDRGEDVARLPHAADDDGSEARRCRTVDKID
jgi:hypothetical protein